MQAQQDTERNSKTDITWFLPVYSPSSCYCRPLNNAELEVLTLLVVESPPILSFLHVWVPPRPRFYEFRDYVILQYLLLKKVGMQVSPHSSNLCFSRVDCTVIYDDSSLSGTLGNSSPRCLAVLLSSLLGSQGKIKVLPSLLSLDYFQLKIIQC